ncbi:MAG: cysteine desulfurase [Candidatus Thermoplasmatota archaeon]|nr:cysteine desulfurase [Candidatus Thermoplasmatota archaeon]MBS3790762.1 cysteine desulfurase [Candidatus Thermoplasmatota archaeon]
MKDEPIYLDNAASSKMDEEVFEAMKPYMLDNFAVATSDFAYSMGVDAKEALNDARETIAEELGASSEEFIFTSCATESSNLALKGVAEKLSDEGDHIIISDIEDFPVLKTANRLEKKGFDVTYLDVDGEGFVDLEQLEESINEDTILVSIQHGNQEIGTLQDIKKVAEICNEKDVIYHTDATHTFGRVPIDVNDIPVDLISVSAHTIHGPRGIGGLYIREGTPLEKQMDGGFQENDLRAGVENIPAAVGFAKAVELIDEEENERIKELRDKLIDGMREKVPDVVLNGPDEKRTPQNANITFHYVEGESITLHLDMRGIAVSTGSACFSKSLEASHVIMGIGGDHERAHGSVRFTFGRFNTEDQVEEVVNATSEIIGKLRDISPLGEEEEE